MGNKLFTKILATGILIIMVSFSMLATFLIMLTARYSVDERTRVISSFGNSLSQLSSLISGPFVSSESKAIFALNLSVIANSLDAQIVVTTTTGQPVIYSDNLKIRNADSVVGSDIMASVNKGLQYVGTGKLGSFYDNTKFNVGIPIKNRSENVIGAVFISSEPLGFSGILLQMAKVFLLSFLIVMLLSIVVTYFTTRVIVAPIKEMSCVSKSFARGDFSVRVTEGGRGEIGELAESFNNMAASLENLEDIRKGFIANVSHDLRTPMTTISGFVDGILDGTIPEEDQKRYLQVVSSEAKRLSRLVKTLLDVSKLESSEYKLSITEFDISETIRRTALSFLNRIETKNLNLELFVPENEIIINADSDALTRVLYNLLDNAVKFTEAGGYILVTLKEYSSEIELKVRNSGGGISKQDLDYIFERFYKSDLSRGLDKSGLGLGLYIVKTLVKKHGGRVSVNSDGGSYCEFIVNLPKKQVEF